VSSARVSVRGMSVTAVQPSLLDVLPEPAPVERPTPPERPPASVTQLRPEPAPAPPAVPLIDPALVEVRRSGRRRRTVSAYREGERTIVLLPARMSKAEEKRWVALMLERLEAQERKRRPSDSDLAVRARQLSQRYLGGKARPKTVRWVSNQTGRWGSCTPVDRSIRLSDRLQGMPEWVVDYVLLHELAHLLVPGHGPEFWSVLETYPRLERARGYLEGVSATASLGLSDD
jgi:predicted metal-dependent hydrolase